MPFGRGGTTSAQNLVPLCRHHHRIKTHGGWDLRWAPQAEGHAAGTLEWTSPSGFRYLVPPDDQPGSDLE